jgi:hypothetical protein
VSQPTGRAPADYDALPADEQSAVRAAWAEDVARRLAALDFAAEYTAAAEAYSGLDERGRVVGRRPHGS